MGRPPGRWIEKVGETFAPFVERISGKSVSIECADVATAMICSALRPRSTGNPVNLWGVESGDELEIFSHKDLFM